MDVTEIQDWAVAHGILLQSKDQDGLFHHAPLSTQAIPFPSSQYMRALEVL